MIAVFDEQLAAARAHLDRATFDYIDGGSGDEASVREATSAWQAVRLRPRVLTDVADVDTHVTLLGAQLRTPIIIAPSASHGLVHADGEVATATGASAAGSLTVVSTRASKPLEDIAAAGDNWWFQVYLMRDRDVTAELVLRAKAAGAGALVLTGDTPHTGRKRRAGRPNPLDHPAALVNFARHLRPGRDPNVALEQDPGATERDIGALAEASGLPVLVKGVLRGDDARRCIDAGAAGIIVSNHGGRQLDQALPTVRALPEVVTAVAGQVPVLVDGGLRSGVHVLAALALGASAVLIGRPALWALAAGGAEGVRLALDALTDDLAHCMALAGAPGLRDIGRDLVDGGT